MSRESVDLAPLGRSRLPAELEKNVVQIVTKPGETKGPLGLGELGRFVITQNPLTNQHAFNVR